MAIVRDNVNKLVLFDIDNTLLNGSECHKLAFNEGFKVAYGVETSIDTIDYLGMTDKEIIFEILKIHGFTEQTVALKVQECIDIMADTFNKCAFNYQIRVLGGVKELLDKLKTNRVIIGLVTGNIESIAWRKLQIAGLDSYFSLGGFGSDDIKRSNLIRLAIRRAADKFDFTFNDNVYVFGDTPRDIRAGIEARVKTIGVATGQFTKDQLKENGADAVFPDLRDTSGVLKFILE
jgi:phosphoglycolate phosphatase